MMETKDWITATLGAIGTATGIYNLVTARLGAKKAAEREVDRRWMLKTQLFLTGGCAAHLDYDGQPIRILAITAVSPPGLCLQTYSLRWGADRLDPQSRLGLIEPDAEGPRRTLTMNRETNEKTIGGGTTEILVVMPRRPSVSRHATTSIRLVVRYEELDAKRKRHEIDVWTHDVPWGA